ncbi:hypothetical protein GEMRC1_008201 [Eukaryota sp. GEM-RC1]
MNDWYLNDDSNFDAGVYVDSEVDTSYPEPVTVDDEEDVFIYLSDRELDLPEIAEPSTSLRLGLTTAQIKSMSSTKLSKCLDQQCTICLDMMKKGILSCD